uniref:Movement protein n=1 Tax=Angiostrongylus cantonensis TaxID=6313 RepID=A0A0K0CV42_ANGCA
MIEYYTILSVANMTVYLKQKVAQVIGMSSVSSREPSDRRGQDRLSFLTEREQQDISPYELKLFSKTLSEEHEDQSEGSDYLSRAHKLYQGRPVSVGISDIRSIMFSATTDEQNDGIETVAPQLATGIL